MAFPPPSSADRYGRAKARGAVPRRLPPVVATKAARGAVQAYAKDNPVADDTDFDRPSDDLPIGSTAYLLQEMQLYGYRPFDDEPDPRPLPDARQAAGAVADIFDGLVSSLIDTRIEPDLEDLLWNVVNIFQRAGERIERELDDNEQLQKRLQREQDGSEVRSVELERAICEGISLIERRDTMEFLRDTAADQFRVHARKLWSPRTGSRVNRRAMTAAIVDSRDFLDKRLRDNARALLPEGTRIAFTGGPDCNDHHAIWEALDRVRVRHPTMILLHGATPTGAERAAACWADNRGVTQVAFRPDWARHKKAAPFKRNDRMLEALPVGLVVFPGTGIQDNLADKARKLGIPLWDFRPRRAP